MCLIIFYSDLFSLSFYKCQVKNKRIRIVTYKSDLVKNIFGMRRKKKLCYSADGFLLRVKKTGHISKESNESNFVSRHIFVFLYFMFNFFFLQLLLLIEFFTSALTDGLSLELE